MPYCELEPLGVVWWERRRGIATVILHEAANRVRKMFSKCTGMLGGDQEFYHGIGYKKKAEIARYLWKVEAFISWERESFDKDYVKEVQAIFEHYTKIIQSGTSLILDMDLLRRLI